MDYTDLDALHAYGRWTEPLTPEDDAMLESFISAASTFIDERLHRRFALATDAPPTDRTYSKDGGWRVVGRVLWLDDDLCSAPVFTETPAPTVTLYPPDAVYFGAPYTRIIRTAGFWPDPTTITGHWAYSKTPPALIAQLCLRLAEWFYHQRDPSETGDRPIIVDGKVILPATLPDDVQAILDLFAREPKARQWDLQRPGIGAP